MPDQFYVWDFIFAIKDVDCSTSVVPQPLSSLLDVVPVIGQAATSAVNSHLVWNWNSSSEGRFASLCVAGLRLEMGAAGAVVVVGLHMEGGWIGLWC